MQLSAISQVDLTRHQFFPYVFKKNLQILPKALVSLLQLAVIEKGKECGAILIYIDSDLGQGLEGEKILMSLYLAGFRNLFLTTGYSPEQFENADGKFKVLGKDAHWGE